MLQLQNANVSRGAVLESIARQLNLGTGDAGNRAALEAIRQRRVSSGVGIQAALDAVRQRVDRGRDLGSFARDQSATLTGALSNARNAIFNMLVGIDFGKIPGLQAFKRALLTITEALQSGSPAAKRMRTYLEGAINTVGVLFASINADNIGAGFGFVSRAFQSIGRFAATAYPVVRAFITGLGPGFAAGIAPLRALFASLLSGGAPSAVTMALIARAALGLGQAFGFVVGTAISFVGVVGSVVAAITTLAASAVGLASSVVMPFRTAFLSVGAAIINGIRDGIAGGAASLLGGIASLTRGTVDAAKNALGIHSPSTVFRDEVGRQIPAGMVDGVSGGAAPVNDAVAGLANPAALRIGGGMGAVSITVNVEGAAQPQETARLVIAEIEDALGSILGRHAEQFG